MSTVMAPVSPLTRPAARERRAERRRLQRQDTLSSQLAELHRIRALLEQAAEIVGAGWLQGAWFTVASRGGRRTVAAYDLRLVRNHPVTGACLVGAIVHAAGGPATVRSQLVQRTLDLTWHALREDPDRPVRWCPGPDVRMLRLLDLTHWNDAPGRTQREVVDLLRTAERTAEGQWDRCRAEQALVTDAEAR